MSDCSGFLCNRWGRSKKMGASSQDVQTNDSINPFKMPLCGEDLVKGIILIVMDAEILTIGFIRVFYVRTT